MDENNNNGTDNPTWFYSSESIIDVKHETIKTKYLYPFGVNITNPSWSGPGHRVSDVTSNGVTTCHLITKHCQFMKLIKFLKCDQDHQGDNIRLMKTFRIDFILLSVSARITAYITAAQRRREGQARG